MPDRPGPPEPWRSFFDDLGALLSEPVRLHCCGGFSVIYAYGVARTTNDCDFISMVPHPLIGRIAELAGQGSDLHRRHRVYLDPVTVATAPESYDGRLTPMFPGTWRNIELFALEPHDLALTKLERNWERDRDDVQRLARAGHLRPDILRERYERELRPHLLARVEWHDTSLRLWLESCWPHYAP